MSEPTTDARQTLHLAFEHHQAGRLKEAESLYRRVLEADPNHVDALHLLGLLAYQAGDYGKAAELIGKAVRVNPRFAEAYYNLGNVFKEMGKTEEAAVSYRNAIRMDPDIAAAHYNLGLVLEEQGRTADAVVAYRNALSVNPADADAFFNLGNALGKLGKREEAIAAYRRAVAANPKHCEAHNNLGIALKAQGELEEAVVAYRRALDVNPDYVGAHYNLANILQDMDRPDEAIVSYRRALALKPDFSEAHNNLGNLLCGQGKKDEALVSYKRALEFNPGNATAAHMLAALTGRATESAPPGYVRNLFDHVSKKFESHLVGNLQYQTPQVLRREMDKLFGREARFKKAVDLGCGTGLSGAAFRDIVDKLCGLDLSPKMIEEAGKKKIYDALFLAEIVEFLRRSEEKYDLFIAADVLVYIGNLRPIFEAVRDRAAGNACFAFCTESSDVDGYVLQSTGRYTHSKSYVESLATEMGFKVESCCRESIRKHNDQIALGDHMIVRPLAGEAKERGNATLRSDNIFDR